MSVDIGAPWVMRVGAAPPTVPPAHGRLTLAVTSGTVRASRWRSGEPSGNLVWVGSPIRLRPAQCRSYGAPHVPVMRRTPERAPADDAAPPRRPSPPASQDLIAPPD